MSPEFRPRVVLVDDYEDLVNAWRRLLAMSCDVVGTASNGQGAIELAASLQPDVMVLDHFMPERTGLDVCPDIQQVSPRTRILLVTAAAEPALEALAKRVGVTEVVFKQAGGLALERAILRVAGVEEPAERVPD